MTPRLSILLATVISRADLFAKLKSELDRQAEGKPVEILVACDNKEISIGKKRDNLLRLATGGHICFIDDDDWVHPNYVDKILAALETSPDCVGFLIECFSNGRPSGLAKASMCYKKWGDNQDGYRFNRSTYHKTPVRREIALAAGFPDMRYGEDKIYSEKVVAAVKTEVFINEKLYIYRFSNSEPFHIKYGTNRRHMKGVNLQHKRRPFFN